MYENSILHKAAIVPLLEVILWKNLYQTEQYLGGAIMYEISWPPLKTKDKVSFPFPGMKKSTVMLRDCCCQTKIHTKTLKNDVVL